MRKTARVEKKPRIYAISFGSLYPLYVQKAERKGRTKDEVDEVLTWLTGYSRAQLQRAVRDGIDLEAYFDAVTLPADAGAAKPAPAIFAAALARLGVPPDCALYVGDHAEQDLAAAAGAGLHALDVGTLPDLGALPKALDRLEGELS